MVSVDDWFNLSKYKERNEYTFVKVDRNLIQSNDLIVEEKGLFVYFNTHKIALTSVDMKPFTNIVITHSQFL